MKKTIYLLSGILFYFVFLGSSISETINKSPDSEYKYDLELTVGGDEITCGYISIQIMQYYNGGWQQVAWYNYYVDGTGVFDLDIPGDNSCGNMKISCIYHANEGGFSCQAASGSSVKYFIRSCDGNPPLSTSIDINISGGS